jgi:hypothetical protein
MVTPGARDNRDWRKTRRKKIADFDNGAAAGAGRILETVAFGVNITTATEAANSLLDCQHSDRRDWMNSGR